MCPQAAEPANSPGLRCSSAIIRWPCSVPENPYRSCRFGYGPATGSGLACRHRLKKRFDDFSPTKFAERRRSEVLRVFCGDFLLGKSRKAGCRRAVSNEFVKVALRRRSENARLRPARQRFGGILRPNRILIWWPTSAPKSGDAAKVKVKSSKEFQRTHLYTRVDHRPASQPASHATVRSAVARLYWSNLDENEMPDGNGTKKHTYRRRWSTETAISLAWRQEFHT